MTPSPWPKPKPGEHYAPCEGISGNFLDSVQYDLYDGDEENPDNDTAVNCRTVALVLNAAWRRLQQPDWQETP